MIPFVCDELQNIYKKHLKMTVNTLVIEKVARPITFVKVPISKETFPILCFKLPTSALASMKCSDELRKKSFLKECGNILKGILEKLREKCPLNIDIIRYMACFSPANMTQRKDLCISKFAKLVMRMYEGMHLKSQKAEDSKYQFELFLMEESS